MRFPIKTIQIYLFFLVVVCSFSCKQSTRPNVSAVKVNIKIERFDQDLFKGKLAPVNQTIEQLKSKYPIFYNDYVQRVFVGSQLAPEDILTGLFKDPAFSDLQKETDSVFPTMKAYEQGLSESFSYVKYYYPAAKIPKMLTFISGFAYQTIVGDDYIGIGLDMFLGKNSQFYGGIAQSVPRYMSRRFEPQYIVPRVMETYAHETLFPPSDSANTLLDKMIYNGKILYFLDNVLAENLPDSLKIGYTDKQLQWCAHYKKEIWAYFMENNLLYNSNYQKIQVYLSDGPFTPGLGVNRESAPKLGIWTGWQIVRGYMKNNPEITLQQLMANTDAQGILNKSKYRP